MKHLINISEATFIAVHALALIAKSENRINVKQIAEQTNTSANHVSKIMQILAKNNYISSTRGPNGGFVLIKKPGMIKLKKVFELFEGKIEQTKCPFHKNKCPFTKCVFGKIINDLTDKFITYLNDNTLKDIIKQK